jgi:hypothetical protein
MQVLVTSRIRTAAALLLSLALLAQLAACGSSRSFGGSGGSAAVGGSGSGSTGGGSGGSGSGGGSGGGAGSGSGGGSSGSGGSPGGATGYPVSVSLSGLSDGDTIVMALNGMYLLTVHWSPPFTAIASFPDRTTGQALLLPAGTRYVVNVSTPPAHKACSASPASGEATGPVLVIVDCRALPAGYAHGAASGLAAGMDSAAGTADGDASLAGAAEAQGIDGTRWRFGGRRAGASLDLSNDLWVLQQGGSSWLRASGEGGVNARGRYPVQGTSSPTADPGARAAARLWVDADGTVWLFGGNGIDADGTYGELMDLWTFDPGTRQWAWAGGEAAARHFTSGD